METKDNDEVLNYNKKFVSKQQKIWNYIRRNRYFKLVDLLMIIDGNRAYLTSYLRALVKAKYLRQEKMENKKDKAYTLIKCKSVYAPSVL